MGPGTMPFLNTLSWDETDTERPDGRNSCRQTENMLEIGGRMQKDGILELEDV